MTAYVVDASVVTEYLVMGHYTPNAVAFFQQMTGVDQLIVPEFCLLECTNVLWKHVRFQGMPANEASPQQAAGYQSNSRSCCTCSC